MWFTGLPAAGKSSVAVGVEQRLRALGRIVLRLDGDELRAGLCKDLGFSRDDRAENVRRAGEVARLIVEAGGIALCALISPYRDDRARVRARFPSGQFFEVFMDAPLAVCEARDPRRIYARARAGELTEVTGIDSPYEPPLAAELVLAAGSAPLELLIEQTVAYLVRAGVVESS